MLEGVNLKWNDFEDNLIRSFKVSYFDINAFVKRFV